MKSILTVVSVIFMLSAAPLLPTDDNTTPRFFIRTAASFHLLSGGDFQRVVDAQRENRTGTGGSDGGKMISRPVSPGVEVGFSAGHYAVSIGIASVKQVFSVDSTGAGDPVESQVHTQDITFQVTPILLYNHLRLVGSSTVTLWVSLGGGMYLASLDQAMVRTDEVVDGVNETSRITAKRNFLGFHGGLTVEVKISRNLSLTSAAMLRIAGFKNIKAETEINGVTSEEEQELTTITHDQTGEMAFWAGELPADWTGETTRLSLNGAEFSVGLRLTF